MGPELQHLNFQHQSGVRKKEQDCDSVLDLAVPAKRNQQERFPKPDELVEGVRTMAGEAGPWGLKETQFALAFQKDRMKFRIFLWDL